MHDSITNGAGLAAILKGTTLQLNGATENAGKCLAIGRTSAFTTDVIVMDCDTSAPVVCGLDTTGGGVKYVSRGGFRGGP